MSTGLECEVVHYQGKWYYFLEQGSAPRERWDWRGLGQGVLGVWVAGVPFTVFH